jgi:nitroreductase
MNVFEAIQSRRSIRKFKSDPIPEDQLNRVLEAARLAPSAGNRQPWRFVVVKDENTRSKLAELADHQTFVGVAPVVIAVFGDPDDSPAGYRQDPMVAYKQDPMIAVEHMCLAAVELGLGTCWIGPASPNYDVEAIKRLLGVPERMYMTCLLPLGYPDQAPNAKSRKPREKIVFYERYSEIE